MADNLPHPSHRRRGKRWCRLIQDRDMRRLPLTRHPDMDLPFATARSRPIGNGARGYDTRNMNSAAGSLTRPMAQSVSSCNTGSVRSMLSGASADGERGVGSAQSDRPQREVSREPL